VKVSFYVDFPSDVSIDFATLEVGNPGIGGTQYATLCLAKELAERSSTRVEIISNVLLQPPRGLSFSRKNSLAEAIRRAKENDSILVFRPTTTLDQTLAKVLEESEGRLIAWAHVTPSQSTLRKLSQFTSVKRVIALGVRQQWGWIDNPVIEKTVVIRNGQYIPQTKGLKSVQANYVTYLGSIVPQKGFHLLAKIWPQIVSSNPNLRLKVVGSGTLYDTTAKLGKLGIAEQSYEDKFMKYLGKTASSVDFLGKVDAHTKNQIVENSFLGIPNPSGMTENCPASALDFQALGVPVVSVRKNGLIDTVAHNETGLLVKNYKDLESAVSQLVSQPTLRDFLASNCSQFIADGFNFEEIVPEWIELFRTIDTKTPLTHFDLSDAVTFMEKLSFLNSKIATKCPLKMSWPTMAEFRTYAKLTLTYPKHSLKKQFNLKTNA
jgi:glycosyltransferase involved in cell wall biosynthesis